MFFSPLAVSSVFGQGIFGSPTPNLCNDDHVTEEVVRLAERSACLVFLIGIWEAGDRQPKRGGNFPPMFGRVFSVGGFPKKGKKKGWHFLENGWWDMNLDCFFWLLFSVGVAFLGGKRRMARPTAFFGGWFLNYRLSMIDDVCVSQGPLNKQRMRYSSSNFS